MTFTQLNILEDGRTDWRIKRHYLSKYDIDIY